jgi:acetylornithine deacetylase/succinyl-diaminopimelate desuccinylase-like protein
VAPEGRPGAGVNDALLAACRSIDPEPIATLALDLVGTPSPPGDERAMAERTADALSRALAGAGADASVRLDEEFPSSPSVIAELRRGTGPTLQWHGHLDAIDVAHDAPRREGEEIVGRGAADMKGPLAAMVAAARLLVDHGEPRDGRVLITFHGRHESGDNAPLHALIARGIHGDAVITGELGGGRELPLGGLGLTFWEAVIERSGMAIHETVAQPGDVDPVEVGRLFHAALARHRSELAARGGPHPGASLFIGQFAAGDYFNRLPERAVLRGTRRHDTDETLAGVAEELRDIAVGVAAEAGATIRMDVTPIAEAFTVDEGAPIVDALQRAHAALTGAPMPIVRSRVATNAVHFVTEAGIPAVCYGPDHATNHSDRESLPIAELARLAGGFALATTEYLSSVSR